MKYFTISMLLMSFLFGCGDKSNKNENSSEETEQAVSFIEVSRMLIENAKAGKSNEDLIEILANASKDSLVAELTNDDLKKAFWINTYNGFIQVVLSKNPEKYEDRGEFFKANQVVVAGDSLSFDDIEHGIIRNSKVKLGLGYIPKIFPNAYEKKFRTEKADPRVHFVLNCGAKSCPPVFAFDGAEFNTQADKVAMSYLSSVSEFKSDENILYTSPLIKWFRGDFGQKDDDLFPMMYQYGIMPEGAEPDIEYVDYDWTLALNNFY